MLLNSSPGYPRRGEDVFRDGPPTVAGGFNPPAAATRVEGGWRITGRCPFASGCQNAAYDDVACSGGLLSVDAKIRLQLAMCFAAESYAEAVRFVNDVTGTASIRLEQPFERYFRDVHVMLQQSDNSSARYGSAGRLMFGLANDWAWLSF